MQTKTIIFTGGGSPGHVTPNIALIEKLKEEDWGVKYIGSKTGIEKDLIEKIGVPFFAISTGKLRRYFSFENFIDPIKILFGIIQSFFIVKKTNPDIVFSKGGFVSFPVVVGAWLNRIPVVVHESDLTPGLANRLSFPFAKKICISYLETKKRIKTKKDNVVVTGMPIRKFFFSGDKIKGRKFCAFPNNDQKILLFMGGGTGAEIINKTLLPILPKLLEQFYVIHLCGKGKLELTATNLNGYKQFEYVGDKFCDLMACADLVISRAGANSLYELIAIKKPHLLIPLPLKKSRGDQLENATFFERKGLSAVLTEESLTPESFYSAIKDLDTQQSKYQEALNNFVYTIGTDTVYNVLCSLC